MSAVAVAARLSELETLIERGLSAFIAVGQALCEIRESRLYRETHETFEDYCRERWDFSRKRAYDLTAAAEVAGELSPIGDTPAPRNEAVARELAPLRAEPDVLRSAWTEAVEQHGPAPTAKQVHEIVSQFRSDPAPERNHDLCPTCGARIPAGRPLPRSY